MILQMLASAAVLVATVSRPGVDERAFREMVLAAHNDERDAVGSPRIEWSGDLARDAAAWGAELARGGGFRHDPGNADQGENLWMGTKGRFSLGQMLDAWAREKGPLRGMASWERDFHGVGHYTQMVWHSTRRVGCAFAHDAQDEFLVCRYDPAGNWRGESPYATGGMAVPVRVRTAAAVPAR